MDLFLAFLQLIRPKQWTKNLVVFAGLMFSANLFNIELLPRAFQACLVFCLATGATYIFNDLRDIEADRLHPEKKNRPLAAGRIEPFLALAVAVLLATASLAWAALLSLPLAGLVLVYMVINLAYSLKLKHFVILDVFVITAGFVLRAAAGALVIAVAISPWLLIVTTLISLFLGFAKRRHELLTMGEEASMHRPSLGEYSPELLDQFMSVVSSSTIIAYSLYAFTSPTAHEHHYLMLTVPFVIYGILRYLYLVYQRNLGGAPELVLLSDWPLIVDILLWVAAAGFILHLG
jgi:4-hydroxybenzoate polyprenyltransferase